ncbi:MAG: M12 family metallopeptidase, partial [Egibacteraceae bacterium]
MATSKKAPQGHCLLKPQTVPVLPPDLEPGRASAIRRIRGKWVNGTVLHYFFMGGPKAQQQAVRDAFATWRALPLGLEFTEVKDPGEAEVRVSFADDGAWSYVGKDVLGIPEDEATMNFGWDLTTDYGRDTALHEIGHTLGMPHEHQNPFAGIEWDEEAVYATFGAPPNNWSRQQTFHNVLRKLDPGDVEGSTWDPNSVMEY